jgi:hypothetical protein
MIFMSSEKVKSALQFALLAAAFIGASLLPAGAEAERLPIPTPPSERPRLFLTTEHATGIAERMRDPVLQPAVVRLQELGRSSPQHRLEWQALQWLAQPDPAQGRAIVEEALDLLKRSQLPDQPGAQRVTGRMMVTGAIVYDWLYPLLTAEEKQQFITELVRLAKTQECGYPPTRQSSVIGHGSEAMIMRDMISAGIAIYDEFPEMYQLAAGRFFREHLPARNWFYNGHAHHQGDSYGPYRYVWDTYPLFIFDRLGAGNVFNPEQQFVPYSWIYTTRPDGQRLRAGNSFKDGKTPRGQPWDEYIGTLLTASYYGDGFLLSQFLRQGVTEDDNRLFEFLWRDTKLQPRPIESLPLSRYFGPPFGWMVARTGWGDDAVLVEMKINEYNFANHQHLDAGAFQIYHRGALATDSGLYHGSSGKYASPHNKNYSWRTIAHNSLLVYDPAEKFHEDSSYGNDGGQRFPNGRAGPRDLNVLLDPELGYRTGKVLAHGFGPDTHTPDYTLLQGDITEAYSQKVRAVTRSFVFLNLRNSQVPGALVVFDRVVSADPAFRKFWLLHTLEEPQIQGTTARVDRTEHGATGRLNIDVVLPPTANAAFGKMGGPGKEFWVFGENFPNEPPGGTKRSSFELGAWRLELSPKSAASEDLFFTVMQVTDQESASRWPVQRLETAGRVGCVIAGPEMSWAVVLRKDNRRSTEHLDFTVSGESPHRFLVADLAPGRWEARRVGSAEVRVFDVAAECGAGWFEGSAGRWTLTRAAGK